MKSLILLMGFFLGISSAFAESIEGLEGKYFNSAYDGEYSNAWVEIRKGELGGYELIFNVPCGTKLKPRVFKITNMNPNANIGQLELIEIGSSQCFTGKDPSFILLGNTLYLSTNPRIISPGFGGVYELTK